MGNLMDFLKRRLNDEEIKLARKGTKESEPGMLRKDEARKGFEHLYHLKNTYVRYRVDYSFTHKNLGGKVYEPAKRTTEFYNTEGLLTKKIIIDERTKFPNQRINILVYDPPGSLFGK